MISTVCGLMVRLSSPVAGTRRPMIREERAARLRAEALGT